jgi:hypothetical protein
MRENAEKCGKMRGNAEKCGKMRGNAGKCGKMRLKMKRFDSKLFKEYMCLHVYEHTYLPTMNVEYRLNLIAHSASAVKKLLCRE